MDKQRRQYLWKEVIIPAYDATIEYGSHGVTGNPVKTIDRILDECTKDELKEVLGVVAHIKFWDERFSKKNREWLYEAVSEAPADDRTWYEWSGLSDLDHIHTAHLDNLAYYLRIEWEKY